MFDDVCEAAHIIPFCESNDQDCFDIDNGILLNKVLHKLFYKMVKNYFFFKYYFSYIIRKVLPPKVLLLTSTADGHWLGPV